MHTGNDTPFWLGLRERVAGIELTVELRINAVRRVLNCWITIKQLAIFFAEQSNTSAIFSLFKQAVHELRSNEKRKTGFPRFSIAREPDHEPIIQI